MIRLTSKGWQLEQVIYAGARVAQSSSPAVQRLRVIEQRYGRWDDVEERMLFNRRDPRNAIEIIRTPESTSAHGIGDSKMIASTSSPSKFIPITKVEGLEWRCSRSSSCGRTGHRRSD